MMQEKHERYILYRIRVVQLKKATERQAHLNILRQDRDFKEEEAEAQLGVGDHTLYGLVDHVHAHYNNDAIL